MEFGSPAYWAAVASGAISWTQAADDNALRQVRSDRAKTAPRRRGRTKRELRPAPRPSRQYIPATPAATACDTRLTETTLRLLLKVLSLAGNGDTLRTTKAGMAGHFSCHPKTIQAALGLLEREGYITRDVWRHESGRNLGVVITVLAKARPFWRGGMGVPALPHLKQLDKKAGLTVSTQVRHDVSKGERHHENHRHRLSEGRQRENDANAEPGCGRWQGDGADRHRPARDTHRLVEPARG